MHYAITNKFKDLKQKKKGSLPKFKTQLLCLSLFLTLISTFSHIIYEYLMKFNKWNFWPEKNITYNFSLLINDYHLSHFFYITACYLRNTYLFFFLTLWRIAVVEWDREMQSIL